MHAGTQSAKALESMSAKLTGARRASREEESSLFDYNLQTGGCMFMKSHEVAVYREIQKNTEMAMKAIDAISPKVYDDDLALQISRQSIQYAELHNEASRRLVDAKAQGYQGNALSEAMLKTGIHYNTLLNTSTGHIAELMIKNSNNGILEMEKALKHNENAGERPTALARQLIDFEEKSVRLLKNYL